MASDGSKLPLLPEFVAQTNKGCGTNKRRFHDLIPKDFDSDVSFTPSKSILGKFQPTVQNLSLAVAIYLGMGTILFCAAIDDLEGEKRDCTVDALYYTITIMTTVGNGDLAPGTAYIKFLSCAFVMTGMGIMGLVVSKAAEYIVEKQEILLVKALRNRQKYGPFVTIKDMRSDEISQKIRLVMCTLGATMFLGFMYLFVGEDLDFFESIFCVVTTMTTVGYRRKAFRGTGGRLFAVIFIPVTICGLGQIFIYFVDLVTQTKQEELAERAITWRMTNVEFNAPVCDNDGVAEVAEFAVRKLEALGKISQDDISCLMKEFEDLDVHRRGFLLASELVQAQSQTKR